MSLNSNRAFNEAAKLPGRVLAPRAAKRSVGVSMEKAFEPAKLATESTPKMRFVKIDLMCP